MLFDISKANIEELTDDLFTKKQVRVFILRLDKIHPVVSGNKLFKLHYFLDKPTSKTIITFGGAYSNHLSATAFACRELKLKSVGIVRGEIPANLSSTLQQCVANGMQLKFISRQQYAEKETDGFLHSVQKEFEPCTIIPEGGYHPLGAKGAALIMDLLSKNKYSHVCTAIGTATTTAGLMMAANPDQKIVGIPVLKGMKDFAERIVYLTGRQKFADNLELFDDYHFGGYAKYNEELLDFMNQYWLKHALPLDFVYTAKMMYAVTNKIKSNYFTHGSEIICLHTGGLQGNNSLPLSRLLY